MRRNIRLELKIFNLVQKGVFSMYILIRIEKMAKFVLCINVLSLAAW